MLLLVEMRKPKKLKVGLKWGQNHGFQAGLTVIRV